MNKKLTTLTAAAVAAGAFMIGTVEADAAFSVKGIKERAKETAERKVERQANKAVDKAADKVEQAVVEAVTPSGTTATTGTTAAVTTTGTDAKLTTMTTGTTATTTDTAKPGIEPGKQPQTVEEFVEWFCSVSPKAVQRRDYLIKKLNEDYVRNGNSMRNIVREAGDCTGINVARLMRTQGLNPSAYDEQTVSK
jgi:hypothetical protein